MKGRVPAIVYGADKPAQEVELDHHALLFHLKREAFHSSILDLALNGEKTQVLLRDYQMHPWKQEVLHVDFQRVDRSRKIRMRVPLHFVNGEIAPGVKTGGGVVQIAMNELDIQCLPDDLPEFIEVDLGGLSVGNSIHARALTLPKGVEPVLSKGEDPVVATVVVPQLITEEEEAAAAAAAVAPSEIPTTEQAAPAKEGEAPAEGADKAKAAEKPAEKPDKKDKK